MKVLFLKDMRGLARKGEIKEVSDGYAMNSLIPHGAAVHATADKLKEHETRLKVKQTDEKIADARHAGEVAKLMGATIIIKARSNEQGHLYHQLPASDIVESVKRETSVVLDTNDIILEQPIKSVGEHMVQIRRGTHAASVTIKVVKGA